MDKEQFYKEFFRYLECGSCADLEFCQKQLEPACKTGSAIYRKLKMEALEKENEQLKQQLAEKEKEYQNILSSSRAVVNAHIEFLENKNLMIIAELEKVKELININGDCDNQGNISWSSIEEIIDQQIKSLKGE